MLKTIGSLAIPLALLFAAGTPATPVFAQDEVVGDGVIEIGPILDPIGYPVGIHQGTCAEVIAEPAYVIGTIDSVQVGIEEDLGADETLVESEVLGSPTFWTLETEIEDVGVDELIATPHAIIVHQDDLAGTDFLACGEIGGGMIDNELPVALFPVGDSALTGVAIFEEGDDGFFFGDEGGVAMYMYQLRPLQQVVGAA